MSIIEELMLISDAQIHIWEPQLGGSPGEVKPTDRIERMDVEQIIPFLDSSGVDRAVLIPPTQEGSSNEDALGAAHRFPQRLAVMGVVDLIVERDLSDWLLPVGMLGIRVNFGGRRRRGWVLDAAFEWLWRSVTEYGIPIMVFAPGQTELLPTLAERYPQMSLIVDHLNLGPDTKVIGLKQALEPLHALGKHRNVSVKISALPCYVDEEYPFTGLRSHILRVIETFGPDRCMFGSDLTRLPCSYRTWIDAMLETITDLSPAEQVAVMHETLEQRLNWRR